MKVKVRHIKGGRIELMERRFADILVRLKRAELYFEEYPTTIGTAPELAPEELSGIIDKPTRRRKKQGSEE